MTVGKRFDMNNFRHKPHVQDKDKRHIEVSLGMACNNRCIFCLNYGQRKFVPFSQVLEEGRGFAEQGYNSVGFIGGDPTIYPEAEQLGIEFSAMGFKHIHMITNGRKFSKMEFLDKMIGAGFNRFSVSVHSHIPDIENKLTGIENGLEQKVQALKNLVQRFREGAFKDRVAINIVMNKMNLPELAATVRYFAEIGIEDMRLLIIRPEGTALRNFDILVPRLSEVREVLPNVIQVAKRRRITLMMDTPPFCLFYDIPGFSKIVAQDYIDEVIADAEADKRMPFSWNHYRMEGKTKEPGCKKCAFNNRCEGVWIGYVKEFGFDEFKPVTQEDLSTV